jgi:hypothetical protein
VCVRAYAWYLYACIYLCMRMTLQHSTFRCRQTGSGRKKQRNGVSWRDPYLLLHMPLMRSRRAPPCCLRRNSAAYKHTHTHTHTHTRARTHAHTALKQVAIERRRKMQDFSKNVPKPKVSIYYWTSTQFALACNVPIPLYANLGKSESRG